MLPQYYNASEPEILNLHRGMVKLIWNVVKGVDSIKEPSSYSNVVSGDDSTRWMIAK